MNNRGQATNMLVAVLVIGLLFGGFTGAKLSNFNPFKRSPKAIQKSETQREEYFRDKIKGIEYRIEERTKNQEPTNESRTIGQVIDNLIANALHWLIILGIFAFVLWFFFGIKIWSLIKAGKRAGRALTQVVRGTQKAKGKMNGEQKKLAEALSSEMDEDSKKLISDIKHKEHIK